MPLGGFRRRARRRGLIVGAAAGAAMAKNRGQSNNDDQTEVSNDGGINTAELEQLQDLKNKGIITEEEYEAKKKQILGL